MPSFTHICHRSGTVGSTCILPNMLSNMYHGRLYQTVTPYGPIWKLCQIPAPNDRHLPINCLPEAAHLDLLKLPNHATNLHLARQSVRVRLMVSHVHEVLIEEPAQQTHTSSSRSISMSSPMSSISPSICREIQQPVIGHARLHWSRWKHYLGVTRNTWSDLVASRFHHRGHSQAATENPKITGAGTLRYSTVTSKF